MEINITTPALLFPAVSLLLLAFTNRFLALATLIRGLKKEYVNGHDENLLPQIRNLTLRVRLIRNMQAFGIGSLLLCVMCMLALFFNEIVLGQILFGISLLLMMLSLIVSLREILISVNALQHELRSIDENN